MMGSILSMNDEGEREIGSEERGGMIDVLSLSFYPLLFSRQHNPLAREKWESKQNDEAKNALSHIRLSLSHVIIKLFPCRSSNPLFLFKHTHPYTRSPSLRPLSLSLPLPINLTHCMRKQSPSQFPQRSKKERMIHLLDW